MITIHPIDTIVSDPDVRGGQPIIAGTNIRLIDVITSYLYRSGTPEELALNYALNLGQVYAALAYYYQHKQEVDDLIQTEADRAEVLLAELEAIGRVIHLE